MFGVSDWKSAHMDAFTYNESDGRKGGNNVVSLLWKYMCDHNINISNPGKKLCLVCDNCSGQNKNRMVIKFFLFIVEIYI